MFSTKFDEKNKVWRGANVPTLFHPKLSLGHAILWRLQKNPNKVSQVFSSLYSDFDLLITRNKRGKDSEILHHFPCFSFSRKR